MSQGPSGAAGGAALASGLSPPAVVRYAGFLIRLLAAVIDVLLVLVLFVSVVALFVAVAAIAGPVLVAAGVANSAESSPVLQALPLLTFLGCALFYFVYFPSSPWQATPGKRICDLRIVCTDGSRVTGGLALLRLVSCVLSIALLLIGFLMIGWTREKTGLHDMICYTRVVHGKRV